VFSSINKKVATRLVLVDVHITTRLILRDAKIEYLLSSAGLRSVVSLTLFLCRYDGELQILYLYVRSFFDADARFPLSFRVEIMLLHQFGLFTTSLKLIQVLNNPVQFRYVGNLLLAHRFSLYLSCPNRRLVLDTRRTFALVRIVHSFPSFELLVLLGIVFCHRIVTG